MKRIVYRLFLATIGIVAVSLQGSDLLVVGQPIGFQVVTGTARVITLPEQLHEVKNGDILVIAMTDWLCESIMNRVAAIVTDRDDVNCHAAIQGKRHDIPVIIGTGDATKKIIDGHVIVVDCSDQKVGRVYAYTESKSLSEQSHRLGLNYTVFSKKSQEIVWGHVENTNNVLQQDRKNAEITKNIVDHHYREFVEYVLWMRRQINYTPEKIIFLGAKAQGHNDFSIKCISLAYAFFGRKEEYLKRIIKSLINHVDYIDGIVQRFRNEKPGTINSLSRIMHEENVKHAPLPSHIRKDELMVSPEKYKKVINQIKAEDQDVLVAAGLFARYWLEKKHLV